ncbi:MAG: aldo/keto reductase [Pirellulaceae bacterium]|nr:aldo/keto reductase [Pirellulaceae bacterium]
MEYCYLGHSGLEVSRLGIGSIPFGTVFDEAASRNIVDMAFDAGCNLIDTSNIYGGGLRGMHDQGAGTSERTVGQTIRGRRDQFVVATKGYYVMSEDVRPNSVGLSRAYLTTQIEASLQRLGTDYIDLYQCHARDFYTPIEETMRVLDDFVKAGKIRYVGVSNWDGWHVVKANQVAQAKGLTRFVSNQIWYNLADRVAEHSVIPACRDEQVSIVVWGAQAQGFLTGRYRRGAERPPAGTTFDIMQDCESSAWGNLAIERNWCTIDRLDDIGQRHGKSIPQIALAWLLQSGNCDVALMGGSKIEHYAEALESLQIQLSVEEIQELTAVSEVAASYPMNFLNLFCRRESSFYGGLR